MIRAVSTFLVMIYFGLSAASAQQDDTAWVQIEAHPTLREAQDRAQGYSGALPDVNGYRLTSGWYAIVLGPYLRSDAEQVLRVYRAERQIPADSFLAFPGTLGSQFWPIGAAVQDPGVLSAPAISESEASVPAPEAGPTDETRAQALRSERLLSARERRELQTALQVAGFYNSTIDGAFGPGTRRSMEDWQRYNGFEATGVLTTRQRAHLMEEFNAPLISVGMAPYADPQAGITVDLPLGVAAFDRHETPFAHFPASTDLGAQVLLISQRGTPASLRSLYEVMQTLKIVPLDGPRTRSKNSFAIEGRGNGIVSHTEAALKDGEIKGFTLIWPEGDENRRVRVLAAIKASFVRTEGVLEPQAGAPQRIDLVAGLNVRKPRLSRSGFFADDSGIVLTVAEVTEGCARITLDGGQIVELTDRDIDLGVALLRPALSLAPIAVAQFDETEPRIASDIAVSGYSYEGALGAPTLTFGSVADVRGPDGNSEVRRLTLSAQAGDAGGPVLDRNGGVLGMLMAPPQNSVLPRDVGYVAGAPALAAMLRRAGADVATTEPGPGLSPDELTRRAEGMTVLVSCWD